MANQRGSGPRRGAHSAPPSTAPTDAPGGHPEPTATVVGDLFASADGALLLLRAFLGVTFTYAGLQKLSNSGFFSATAPGSFQQQLRGSILTSPLHHLLTPFLHVATPVAVLISLGEVAVGLGTLLGLYGRVAALGGMLLALSFFLTVSFNDNPYYYGPDIVFLFAWTPFVLGGSGPWSLDAAFAARVARARQVGAAAGRSPARRRQAAEIERRAFMQKASAAGVLGVTALVLGGIVAAVGRIVHGSQPAGSAQTIRGGATAHSTTTTSVTTTTTVPPGGGATTSPPTTTTPVAVPKGTRIGPASDVPVGGAASFTDPAGGEPALVVQRTRGSFKAFSAVCPHAGCQVQFDQQNDLFVCPCHGSTFNAGTGAVLNGPAVTGLSPIAVALGPNNQLYVDG